jgi:NitT/TauT family transport system permease protein
MSPMSGSGDRARGALTFALVPAVIVASWHAAATFGWISQGLLPTPGQVALTLVDLMCDCTGDAGRYGGRWWDHAGASLLRVYAGFSIALLVAVPTGVLIGLSRTAERLLDPTIQLVRNIPVTGFLPVVIIFFGISDRPAIGLIALGAFFPAVVNTTYGVRQVHRLLVRTGEMMGASRAQIVARIVVPAASPAIFTGVRLAMGVAWVLVVVAEFIAVRSGLGYLLFDSYQFFAPAVTLAAMFSIGALGFLSDRLILLVRARLLAWNRLETLRG